MAHQTLLLLRRPIPSELCNFPLRRWVPAGRSYKQPLCSTVGNVETVSSCGRGLPSRASPSSVKKIFRTIWKWNPLVSTKFLSICQYCLQIYLQTGGGCFFFIFLQTQNFRSLVNETLKLLSCQWLPKFNNTWTRPNYLLLHQVHHERRMFSEQSLHSVKIIPSNRFSPIVFSFHSRSNRVQRSQDRDTESRRGLRSNWLQTSTRPISVS